MTIRWTPTALRDLESLHAYIAADSGAAAAATVEKILAGLESVQRFPGMGRKGRLAGTREFVVPPFIVAYQVTEDVIKVEAIIHGARRWPDSF
ncbi:MAG TPA: type II toxin-antitoxin system RelE/ParE family toxin [Bryobacteraceae bacterium]|jgi:toxin ParE1/3/4|nr:type II toxin-antitoxin system RelE/ParE family toxin [Bryobacteraceae bacterium]